MERNINDVNREPFWQRVAGDGFLSDLTKKLIASAGAFSPAAPSASAGEKASAAVGAKAGEAIGNKLFGDKSPQKKKPNSSEGAPKAVEQNKGKYRDVSLTPSSAELGGIELVKLLQAENEKPLRSNIHEIYKRLLSDE